MIYTVSRVHLSGHNTFVLGKITQDKGGLGYRLGTGRKGIWTSGPRSQFESRTAPVVFPAPDGLDSSRPASSLDLSYSRDLRVISGGASGAPGARIHMPDGGPGSIQFDFVIGE